MDTLTSLLKTLLLDTCEVLNLCQVFCIFADNLTVFDTSYSPLSSLLCQPQFSLPSGWGLCDGVLSLLLHTLSEVRPKCDKK